VDAFRGRRSRLNGYAVRRRIKTARHPWRGIEAYRCQRSRKSYGLAGVKRGGRAYLTRGWLYFLSSEYLQVAVRCQRSIHEDGYCSRVRFLHAIEQLPA